MPNIKIIVEECLSKLVRAYEADCENFLTESDVASSLSCLLKDKMKKQDVGEFRVHSGLRPYIEEDGKDALVLRTEDSSSIEWKWKKHEPKNSGSVVDIVIVSKKRDYFEKAKDTSATILKKYWRLVTYPLEAFKVCIEVKIRVSGNIKRIKRDINKLRMIREANKDCLVYLIVADRRALPTSKENIKNCCEENDIPFYIAFLSHQT